MSIVKEVIESFRKQVIPCGCSGCREFRRVTTYWCDKFETAYEQDMLDRDKQKCVDLDALEIACERVLDAESLMSVIIEKRKIKEGVTDEQ
jgi:hypothetical protein